MFKFKLGKKGLVYVLSNIKMISGKPQLYMLCELEDGFCFKTCDDIEKLSMKFYSFESLYHSCKSGNIKHNLKDDESRELYEGSMVMRFYLDEGLENSEICDTIRTSAFPEKVASYNLESDYGSNENKPYEFTDTEIENIITALSHCHKEWLASSKASLLINKIRFQKDCNGVKTNGEE